MCQHMLYEYLLRLIVDPYDQSESIALDVEYRARANRISRRK